MAAAAAAAARGQGETPPLCPARGTGTAPRPLPPAHGARGTGDWRVISLPGCGIHRLCIKTEALHPEGKGMREKKKTKKKKEKKKRGKAKSSPFSSVVPIWLLAACLPLVSVTAIPVCSDAEHWASSLEESHTLLAGRRGRAAAAAAAALPCWLRDANVPWLPAGRHHPESEAQASNSSTCRPITQ